MNHQLSENLERLTAALERLSPPPLNTDIFETADAFIWMASTGRLHPVSHVDYTPSHLLRGVTTQYARVLENTRRFSEGRPANNVMLWGARGMGKSSIVKAAQAEVNAASPGALAIIEIQAGELRSLPDLMMALRSQKRRCILFFDDLSFESQDANYKLLKSALDGGLLGRPDNVVFYATSNRRHLMPRDVMENESGTAIDPKEVVEEKVSLSDRFGLWIGLYGCDQTTFLEMVDAYAQAYQLAIASETLHREALVWSLERGARSGRVARQFVDSLVETIQTSSPRSQPN